MPTGFISSDSSEAAVSYLYKCGLQYDILSSETKLKTREQALGQLQQELLTRKDKNSEAARRLKDLEQTSKCKAIPVHVNLKINSKYRLNDYMVSSPILTYCDEEHCCAGNSTTAQV